MGRQNLDPVTKPNAQRVLRPLVVAVSKLVLSTILVFVISSQGSAKEAYVLGYPESWSSPAGKPAKFFLSGKENATTPLTIYDAFSNPRANLVAPITTQSVAPTNTESWKDGYGWQSQVLDVPDLPSGLYFISGPDENQRTVPFIISEPEKQADIVVIYPTNTVNAYTATPNFHDHPKYGESVSLYTRNSDNVNPHAVSFHRPMLNTVYQSRRFDQMMLGERTESFKYISDADLEDYSAIAKAKMIVIPSHSEYWTANARRNFDKFVDLGGSALVLSGNVMYRAVEYDNPSNPTQLKFWPRYRFTSTTLEYPIWESIGSDFWYGGFGPEFRDFRDQINNPFDGYKVLDASMPYFEGTGLSDGDVIHNPAREYDGVPHTSLDPETGPVVDHDLLGFHRLDVVAFENTKVLGVNTAGTWIDFQKTPESGRVINVGEAHWTMFFYDDGPLRKQITHNMMDLLLITQADFNNDYELTGEDFDMLRSEVASGSVDFRYDLTEDHLVDNDDLDRWLEDFAGSSYGDANLDGRLTLVDFLAVVSNFQKPGGWSQGDFNGTGFVDFADYLVFAEGINAQSSNATTADAVPEPSASVSMIICAIISYALLRRQERRSHRR